jgi:D-aminoacyl-tRNA deacylase
VYPLLIASKQDICAMNMASYMINQCGMQSIYNNSKNELLRCQYFDLLTIDGNALEMDDINKYINNGEEEIDKYTCFIFLSRHRSESSKPTLTCHSTGNFGDVVVAGGNAHELALTYPSLQKCYMLKLWSNRGKVIDHGYDIVIEATHHGPTSLPKPVLFIEIGSSEKQWNDINAISTVCESLLATVIDFKQFNKVAIALGGTHYPYKFTNMLIESDIALASVASKHNLMHIDKSMLKQMIDKSVEEVKYIILDWKGLGREKDRLVRLINDFSYEYGLEVIKV